MKGRLWMLHNYKNISEDSYTSTMKKSYKNFSEASGIPRVCFIRLDFKLGMMSPGMQYQIITFTVKNWLLNNKIHISEMLWVYILKWIGKKNLRPNWCF